MNNVIYAYKKKDENKIVYIGQTINLNNRHYRHVKIDPWDDTLREYNYPLSRGIRKHGEDAYELIVLEDGLDRGSLDEKEKFYIRLYDTYYNGYNQSLGGSNPVMVTYNENDISQVVSMLKDFSIPYKEISEKTGLSLTHIYNINSGERRPQEGLTYPIRPSNTKGTRGIKFSQAEIEEIHNLITNTKKSFCEIARECGCTDATIRKINKGERKAYILSGFEYPLRKKINK